MGRAAAKATNRRQCARKGGSIPAIGICCSQPPASLVEALALTADGPVRQGGPVRGPEARPSQHHSLQTAKHSERKTKAARWAITTICAALKVGSGEQDAVLPRGLALDV